MNTDVVMVWHAYQLNPRNFLEDCLLENKMDVWRAGLPWAMINACIDNDSFEYNVGAEAMLSFESLTNRCWDNIQDPESAEIECPKCDCLHTVPWTKWDIPSAWRKNSQGGYCGEEDADGYADKNFAFTCKNYEITHGVLRAQKFRKDCAVLRYHDIPMQGTCLDENGQSLTDQLPT